MNAASASQIAKTIKVAKEIGARKKLKIVLCFQIDELRASSYEPGNRAGSVTGTNSVASSYGKF